MIAPLSDPLAAYLDEFREGGSDDLLSPASALLEIRPDSGPAIERALRQLLAAYLAAGFERSAPGLVASLRAALVALDGPAPTIH